MPRPLGTRPEDQRADRSVGRHDRDPARHAQVLPDGDLATHEPVDDLALLRLRQAHQESGATAAPGQGHHKAGKLRRPSPAGLLDAERPMPAERRAAPALGRLEAGVPDQRAVAEHPKRSLRTVGQEPVGHLRPLLIAQRREVRVRTRSGSTRKQRPTSSGVSFIRRRRTARDCGSVAVAISPQGAWCQVELRRHPDPSVRRRGARRWHVTPAPPFRRGFAAAVPSARAGESCGCLALSGGILACGAASGVTTA
jgi:hypothetical protein